MFSRGGRRIAELRLYWISFSPPAMSNGLFDGLREFIFAAAGTAAIGASFSISIAVGEEVSVESESDDDNKSPNSLFPSVGESGPKVGHVAIGTFIIPPCALFCRCCVGTPFLPAPSITPASCRFLVFSNTPPLDCGGVFSC
jgi:hypothetical protein